MSFYQKLRLILAMGLLPQGLVSSVEYLNNLRNKIAHELDFELGDEVVSDFRKITNMENSFPPGEQEVQFPELLYAILFKIEEIRHSHQYRRMSMQKASLNARRVLYEMDVEYKS